MGANRRLVILLSIIAFVRCDFSPTSLSAPISTLKKSSGENTAGKITTFATTFNDSEKTKFSFHNFYHGSYSPLQFPSPDFSKFNYIPQFYSQTALKPFFSTPHISTFQGISPPFSNVFPPIFGSGNTPSFPSNPSQGFPPSISLPSFPKPPFNPPIAFPPIPNFGSYSNYFGNVPINFSNLPTSSFSSIYLFSKDSPQHSESVPISYGPPAAPPLEEPSSSTESSTQTSENNSPNEQQPISFPYEPAAPDVSEQQPFTPAQEYGPPNKQ